jgi:hypothetical protein
LISLAALAGEQAQRGSWGSVSRGTPIIITGDGVGRGERRNASEKRLVPLVCFAAIYAGSQWERTT